MSMALYALAERFIGEVRERPGKRHEPFIQWCLASCGFDDETPDETPWCSAWLNRCAWILRLPRSKSAAARSWLGVGTVVPVEQAQVGDVVVLSRGAPPSGHVGLFAGYDGAHVLILGGNQGNGVSVAPFERVRILGIRRLE